MNYPVMLHIRISDRLNQALKDRAVKDRRKLSDTARVILENAVLPEHMQAETVNEPA